jgi:hypothetical protein
MQANEIMISDYLSYEGQIIKVASITKKKVGYHIKDNEYRMHYARLCECKPVFITPEILEKLGFVGKLCSNGIDYVSEEYKLRIICRTNDEGWTIYANHFGLDKKDVFVHELQHALRLCGIEKEIKLED